jgi:hypothetical protein
VLPNSDGDAKRIHRDLSWFGQKMPYIQRGEVLYFLAPKCLCRVTSCERGSQSQVSRKRKNRVLLEMLIFPGEFFVLLFYRLKWRA